MVNKCSAPECKSGYNGSNYDGQMFMFPSNESLRNAWIRATPRADFRITKHSRLCELHFSDDDYLMDRTDSHQNRGKKRGELTRKRLKPTVIPHMAKL